MILAQLVRYDWRLDEAAMVFGARPLRTFWEVTLPSIWPAVLGAFLVSFILGFNNFEISFYNLGAVPTLPTVAWGTLRHGIEPELYALATLVNLAVFALLFVLYLLLRTGLLRLGAPHATDLARPFGVSSGHRRQQRADRPVLDRQSQAS